MDIKVVVRNKLWLKRGQYKRATSSVSLESDVAGDQQYEQRPGCQWHNQHNAVAIWTNQQHDAPVQMLCGTEQLAPIQLAQCQFPGLAISNA